MMRTLREIVAALFAVCQGVALMAQSPGTFAATGSMTSPRQAHTATLLLDGKVLLAGGYTGGDDSPFLAENTAELYDHETGTFAVSGVMASARAGHTATRLPDGRVLIAGGNAGTDAEIYDPTTGKFTSTGRMTTNRQWHTATLLNNGKVLISGGLSFGIGYIGSAELYDPVTGVFTATANMTAARYGHKATLLTNGKVLIAPGSDGADYTSAELYDPDNGAFTPLDFTNSHGLVAATANLLTNGSVLLTLEVGECDFSTRSANLYDLRTATFIAIPDMTSPHCQSASASLPDGGVLIVGSLLDSVGPLPGAEVYDPVAGAFSRAGSMTTGRNHPTATLLKNGQVLVAGGAGVSAELYTPASTIPPPMLSVTSSGQGAILHADTHQAVSPANPAAAGEVLELYGSGLIEGSVIPPQAAIGGRMAEVLFFCKAPGYAGLNQVNVRAPSGVSAGPAVPVRLTYLDRPSNEVTLAVR